MLQILPNLVDKCVNPKKEKMQWKKDAMKKCNEKMQWKKEVWGTVSYGD